MAASFIAVSPFLRREYTRKKVLHKSFFCVMLEAHQLKESRVEPQFKTVEITVKFIADEYKHNQEVYVQRVNYDWVLNHRPTFVQQVIAVVNGLVFPLPEYRSATPGSYTEVK
jgi:hypothetical protein